MGEFSTVNWLLLHREIDWGQCEAFLISENKYFDILMKIIESDKMFDEIQLINRYIKSKERDWLKNSVVGKWVDIFKHFDRENIDVPNVRKTVEFFMAIPCSNAPVERVFSLINNFWTDDKSSMQVETVRSAMMIKLNIEKKCSAFLEEIKSNSKLLSAVKSDDKYQQ